jgi:Fe-S cluster assembly protein SufB
VFTDGSFVYVPPGVRCPMELSTYFRINAKNTGQFERTLIIADKGAYVSYLEGCTAPQRDEHQLHAASVELIAHGRRRDQILDRAELVSRRRGRQGRHLQLRHQARHLPRRTNSKISWTQVETGSAITWKYPSCILQGDDSAGRVLFGRHHQQFPAGRHRHQDGAYRQEHKSAHRVERYLGGNRADNTYRGLVKVLPSAENARNFTQCDSLLIGDQCGAHTVPYIECRNETATLEHEATTAKISDDQKFYCQQRGLSEEEAVALIVNGFCREVLQHMPMEFAVEAQKLIAISLEGSVG